MPPFAEFAVTTNYSFLRGGSHPKELVKRAHELGYAAIGIADRNSVAGVVRAYSQAKELDFRIAVGSRLVFSDGTPDILAYPTDRAAYGRLCRLLTVGNKRAEKGDCILQLDDLIEFAEGLLLILIPPRPDIEDAAATLKRLSPVAPHSLWLGASMLYRGDDRRHIKRLTQLSNQHNVPLIALGDVLYHAPERRALQDVLTCIREHATLDNAGLKLQANAERHLKSPDEIARLFRPIPEAVEETTRFLDRCRFSLDDLRYEYPHETYAGFATPQDALVAFTEDGARKRYPEGVPPKVLAALPFFSERFFHNVLRGDAGVIGARHPQGVCALHTRKADEDILKGAVERMAHVKDARHIGRGDDDRVRRARGVRLCVKEAVGFPPAVQPFFNVSGIVGGRKLGHLCSRL